MMLYAFVAGALFVTAIFTIAIVRDDRKHSKRVTGVMDKYTLKLQYGKRPKFKRKK